MHAVIQQDAGMIRCWRSREHSRNTNHRYHSDLDVQLGPTSAGQQRSRRFTSL